MRVVWVVLLAGCGFKSQPGMAAPDDGVADAAPGVDASLSDAPRAGAACWTLDSDKINVHLSACPLMVGDDLSITSSVTIDTTTGRSSNPAISCTVISDGAEDICALAAKSITLADGATLTAHGDRPLALLAHGITLNGAIDVASHAGQPAGAGATPTGCNPPRPATQFGGGGGGGLSLSGAPGGPQGGIDGSEGGGGATITVQSLRGGCEGGGGGGGGATGDPHGVGGAGGGAVWLSVDTGSLVIANTALINASGAGGSGGTMNHGGSGGGTGGLIVLQAKTVLRSSSMSPIFAEGGGGGGGGKDPMAGEAGHEAVSPSMLGKGGGGGGPSEGGHSGNGGDGAPARDQDGVEGDPGGGGGGGATGLIWVASGAAFNATNVDPDPVILGNP